MCSACLDPLLCIHDNIYVHIYVLGRSDMPPLIIGPLISKYRMYLLLLFLIFVSISMEILAHALLVNG
jgi:hypothetical protein